MQDAVVLSGVLSLVKNGKASRHALWLAQRLHRSTVHQYKAKRTTASSPYLCPTSLKMPRAQAMPCVVWGEPMPCSSAAHVRQASAAGQHLCATQSLGTFAMVLSTFYFCHGAVPPGAMDAGAHLELLALEVVAVGLAVQQAPAGCCIHLSIVIAVAQQRDGHQGRHCKGRGMSERKVSSQLHLAANAVLAARSLVVKPNLPFATCAARHPNPGTPAHCWRRQSR